MKKIKIIMIMFIGVVIIACKKNTTAGPVGPQGPQGTNGSTNSQTGNFIGFINYYDENGNKIKPDTNLVVSIFGKAITTKPDTAGKYTLKNVPQGNYNLFFSTNNFGTSGLINQSVSGSGNIYLQTSFISRTPTYALVASTATVSTNINIYYTAATTATVSRKVAIFMSDNNNVSSSPSNYKYFLTGFIPSGVTGYSISVNPVILNSSGFTSGQNIYLKLYPMASLQTSSSYQDTLTGRQVYNAINLFGASTASFVMP